eukprot:17845-Heterococcus_DN1.PRE.5
MHLVHADSEMPLGVHSAECKQLAELASIAVDFAKTGIPASFPVQLAIVRYPHWMERRDSPSYKSTSVLAQLYERTLEETSLAGQSARGSSSSRSSKHKPLPIHLHAGFEVAVVCWSALQEHIEETEELAHQYTLDLWRLMALYGISNKMEFMSGRGQMSHKAKGTRQRNGEAQARMERQIAKLRKQYRQQFKEQLQEAADYSVTDAAATSSASMHDSDNAASVTVPAQN